MRNLAMLSVAVACAFVSTKTLAEPPSMSTTCRGTLNERTKCLEDLVHALDEKLTAALAMKATEDELTALSLRVGPVEKLLVGVVEIRAVNRPDNCITYVGTGLSGASFAGCDLNNPDETMKLTPR